MLLIVEIAFTIFLCFKYHKVGKHWAKGLIPMGIIFSGGLIIGFVLPFIGITGSTVTAIGLSLDVFLIGYLIWLFITIKSE